MDPLNLVLGSAAILCVILLFVLKPMKEKKRSARLLELVKGKFTFPLGIIQFRHSDMDFKIVHEARGGGVQHGRSCAVLCAELVTPVSKFIIGHRDSKDFTLGQFLIMPPFETFEANKLEILVGSPDSNLIVKAKKTLSEDKNLQESLSILFQKKFSHLTIANEIVVGGALLLRKRQIVRFVCLPHDIYENPENINFYLNTISAFVKKLSTTV